MWNVQKIANICPEFTKNVKNLKICPKLLNLPKKLPKISPQNRVKWRHWFSLPPRCVLDAQYNRSSPLENDPRLPLFYSAFCFFGVFVLHVQEERGTEWNVLEDAVSTDPLHAKREVVASQPLFQFLGRVVVAGVALQMGPPFRQASLFLRACNTGHRTAQLSIWATLYLTDNLNSDLYLFVVRHFYPY